MLAELPNLLGPGRTGQMTYSREGRREGLRRRCFHPRRRRLAVPVDVMIEQPLGSPLKAVVRSLAHRPARLRPRRTRCATRRTRGNSGTGRSRTRSQGGDSDSEHAHGLDRRESDEHQARAPNLARTGPATTRPSGVPIPQIAPIADIAFARIATGMRSVKIAWIDGLQMPFRDPADEDRSERAPGAPTSRVRIQSGQPPADGTDQRDQPQAVDALGTKKRNESEVPDQAPAPKPAKSRPAIVACASKRSIDEHGHGGEERRARPRRRRRRTGSRRAASGSRTRKRSPASIPPRPPPASAAARAGDEQRRRAAKETTYVSTVDHEHVRPRR